MPTLLRCALVSLFFATVASGCGHHFRIQTVDRFVELEPGAQSRRGYAMRAATVDGVVVAVREIGNDRHASRSFWAEAVKNQLRRDGGYTFVGASTVTTSNGREGQRLRFGRGEGEPYTYWVTVFADRDRIFLVEAGGRQAVFEAAEADVEAMLATFRPD